RAPHRHDGVRGEALVGPAQGDGLHDDLVVGDARPLTHDGRLHDPLTLHHRTDSARPGGVDDHRGDRPAVEGGVVVAVHVAVVGDDDAHRGVELAEASQDPVLAPLHVVTGDAHRAEELLGHVDLPTTVDPLVRLGDAELARVRDAGQDPLGVALTDPLQRLAGHHVQVPGLGVVGRRRPRGDRDDLGDQLPRHRVGAIPADAAAAEHHVVESLAGEIGRNADGGPGGAIAGAAHRVCSPVTGVTDSSMACDTPGADGGRRQAFGQDGSVPSDPTTSRLSVRDWLSVAAVALMWGSSFLFIKIGVPDLPSATVAWLRISLGAAALPCLPIARTPLRHPGDRRLIAVLGIVWMAIPFTLFAYAEVHISSALAG